MRKYHLILEMVTKHQYSISNYTLSLFAACELSIKVGNPDLVDKASLAFDICAGELFNDGSVSIGNVKLLEDIKEELSAELSKYGLNLYIKYL